MTDIEITIKSSFEQRFQELQEEVKAGRDSDGWTRSGVRETKWIKSAIADLHNATRKTGRVTTRSILLRYGLVEYWDQCGDDIDELEDYTRQFRELESVVRDEFVDQELDLSHMNKTVGQSKNLYIQDQQTGLIADIARVLNMGNADLKRHLIAIGIVAASEAGLIPVSEQAEIYRQNLYDLTKARARHCLVQGV